MATQNFKTNLFLNLYREGEKNITLICFLLLLKREVKNVYTYSLFPPFGDPGLPACYPLTHLRLVLFWKVINYWFNFLNRYTFSLPILSFVSFGKLCFSKNWFILSRLSKCEKRVVHRIHLNILLMFVRSEEMFLLSFLL